MVLFDVGFQNHCFVILPFYKTMTPKQAYDGLQFLCRFVPEKFDEIFAKHAKTVPDALTSNNIDELLQANRKSGDQQGLYNYHLSQNSVTIASKSVLFYDVAARYLLGLQRQRSGRYCTASPRTRTAFFTRTS
jgi:hypothetical protein